MTLVISDAILGLSLTKFLLHLLNFAILFVALWLILYKPVMKFIRERQERIDREKREAEENLRASEEARRETEERLGAIDREIEEKRHAADREIESACEDKLRGGIDAGDGAEYQRDRRFLNEKKPRKRKKRA